MTIVQIVDFHGTNNYFSFFKQQYYHDTMSKRMQFSLVLSAKKKKRMIMDNFFPK